MIRLMDMFVTVSLDTMEFAVKLVSDYFLYHLLLALAWITSYGN